MGRTMHNEIEIQAPPEVVRKVFRDFPRYKEWSKWQIEPTGASTQKAPTELSHGDTLSVKFPNMSFKTVVHTNSTDEVSWIGSLPYVFTGHHHFIWSPNHKTLGSTTFVQHEDFSGLLAFMVAEWSNFHKTSLKEWDDFSSDLKKEAERLAKT